MIASEPASATAVLAHEMVVLEQLARAAEAEFHYARADALWRRRDDVRHERSLLMRQEWRLRVERLWGPL